MKDYSAPLRDMQFVLRELAPIDEVARLPGCEEFNLEVADAILKEAAKFAASVLSPLAVVGDREGSKVKDGEVTTPPGWKDAYRQFVDGGWNALACPPEFGGQGAPRLVSALAEEMWNSANMSFALCPMLTRGAIESLELKGSKELKERYLPKLVSGQWTGTMVLTEPQAGSDLSAVRTRAVPQKDGTYKLEGQKIFITYGEHDLAENIVHLVLARTPDAPEGVKGISLFLVPKFLPNADGSLGARNDVRCASLEHKLGIHASPTAVLVFGDAGGATGWLVGEENRGLEYMFITMNAARYAVGIEGVGLCERAYQLASTYAKERLQGTEAGTRSKEKVAIVRHPDVRRMLMLMKSRTEASRALAAVTAAAWDTARCHPDATQRQRSQAFVDLMIPVVKAWSTDNAIDVASLGIQVHGGMGFIEETGAAQHLRDARILLGFRWLEPRLDLIDWASWGVELHSQDRFPLPQAALGDIVAQSVLYERCNGLDDTCNDRIDEGLGVFDSIREAIQMLDFKTPQIEITTLADIPAGTGLGSSGSFTTGLLKALYAHRRRLLHPHELAELACHIEIDRLGEPIGKQDQYIAAYGGLQYIQFNPDETVFVDPIICRPETRNTLFSRLLLLYTGITRSADHILQEQSANTTSDASKRRSLQSMTGLARDLRDALQRNDADCFGELLHAGWLEKKKLASGISTSRIDEWYELGMKNGGLGGKLIP